MNNEEKNFPKTNINWLIPIYSNFSRKPLFTMTYED